MDGDHGGDDHHADDAGGGDHHTGDAEGDEASGNVQAAASGAESEGEAGADGAHSDGAGTDHDHDHDASDGHHDDDAATAGASTDETGDADDHSGQSHSEEGHSGDHSDGDGGHDDGGGGHGDDGGHGHGGGVHVGHDTPNPPLTTCFLPSAPGGARNYSRCQSLPGQVPMSLYWDVDEAAGTLTAAFTAQSIGWAAFAFNGADEADAMLSGDAANPNVAVAGRATGADTAAVGVYALRAKASAGVQPIGSGVYTGLTATRDAAGALVVGFTRPLAGARGAPAVPTDGTPVNAIWSTGPPSPSAGALRKHVGHGLGGIDFTRSDLDATAAGGGDADGSDGGGDDESACFPASAMVDAGDRGAVRMADLRVGDAVASAAAGGAPTDVYLFTHADADAVTRFVVLTTGGGRRPLVVSPGHYVFLAGGRTAAARTVRVGDALVDAATGAAAPVTAVSRVLARGLYNPQTLSGDLAVDGYAVSTWTTAVAPAVASAALAPVRAVYGVGGGWLWGGVGLRGGWPRLAALLPSGRDSL
ncbi:hypothetical protein BU14_0342s0018 [Porphyra umbilicalis]|uniref:DOMON domain-containing protein n=1 Tax=Porphyra umbilicalis TaxID=2786 RepID=A0A1X6NY21_PORUM|nr:hypothetical protein BU14_0342s0018 [Porphyra umbilicalis]|eukprot:OSX73498.1 hypothetical protein BU14_0342s0018 [Porphyra umbilicalis]